MTEIIWCKDGSVSEEVASFFVNNTEPEHYIAHTDIQWGRACEYHQWNNNIHDKVKSLVLTSCCNNRNNDKDPIIWTALCYLDSHLAGMSFVTLHETSDVPYATIEDLIVSEVHRNKGIGSALINWIMNECRGMGFRLIFLESAMKNTRAQEFFSRMGFCSVSLVMSRQL